MCVCVLSLIHILVCQHGITPSFIFRRFAVRCSLTISSWLRNHKERPTVFHGMNLLYRTLDARIIATYVCVKNVLVCVKDVCPCPRKQQNWNLQCVNISVSKKIKFFVNIIVDNSCLLLNTHTLGDVTTLNIIRIFFLNILKNLF